VIPWIHYFKEDSNMKSSATRGAAFGLACIALCASALADPEAGPASCAGYEAADVSPPGSEDGPFSQFGMPGILAFIDAIIASTGLPRGTVIATLARFHEGSHEACDEVVGVPPGAE
jgi:hypothetical protein